jgi:hypothetical protein
MRKAEGACPRFVVSSVQFLAGPDWMLGPSYPVVRAPNDLLPSRFWRRGCLLAIHHLNT